MLRARLAAAALVGAFGATVTLVDVARFPGILTDLDQTHAAARFLSEGRDPYALIGPGREWPLLFPYYYPLTAPLVTWPLHELTRVAARAVFVGLSAALLAFGLTRDGFHRLAIFAAPAFVACAKLAQWTPLLAVPLAFPWLGFVLAAKPNVGLVVLAAARTLRDALVMAVTAMAVTVLSLILWPGWVHGWRTSIAGATHVMPTVLLPGGFLLLPAGLCWRDWRGRLLLALAIIPQTPGLVAGFVAFLIPQTFRGVAALGVLSFIPYALSPGPDFGHFDEYARATGTLTLWSVYLPALGMLLWSRRHDLTPAGISSRGGRSRSHTTAVADSNSDA